MLAKVAVVGAGNVGATAAQRLAEKNLARTVVMIDVVDGVPQGKGLDQWQSGPIEGFDTRIIGSNNYDEAAGADVFVVTAGIARKPGMSRDDLVKTNAGIVRSVAEQIAPGGAQVHHRGGLQSARRDVLRRHEGQPVPPRAGARYGRRARHRPLSDVPGRGARRVGRGHPGDGAGRPRRHDGAAGLLHHGLGDSRHPAHRQGQARRDRHRTRNGGAEIVAFLKTGSAYYAPSAAAVQMVEAIALDKKRILPCSAWLQGEFGLRDVFCGVPCKVGRKGLERIIEVTLTGSEQEELHKSAEAVRVDAGRRRRVTGRQSMNRLRRCCGARPSARRRSWPSPASIWVAYLITHMLANLLVFQGPAKINAYSAFLHGTGGALWAARLVLIAALVLHVVAAIQLTARQQEARPVGLRRRPQAPGLDLACAHHALGRRPDPGVPGLPHPAFHRGHGASGLCRRQSVPQRGHRFPQPRGGRRSISSPWPFVGLHLYHGVWSSGRSLGVSPAVAPAAPPQRWRWCWRFSSGWASR